MSEARSRDEHWMAHALGLAKRAWGETHPNPMVGAVLVACNDLLAEGWHRRCGGPHAEVDALAQLDGPVPEGATLYVTLEPCSTEGRTGACTEAIQRAGIRDVVVGALDPNPAHAGRGIDLLRAAGVTVRTGVLGDECEDLNLIFNHWIVHQRPLVALKMALTLDGKFAAASGQARWVTGGAARADVMRWRRYFPAIAVSANTVLLDDPRLTSRTGDRVYCPRRLVLDRHLRTVAASKDFHLFTDADAAQTVLVCLESAESARKQQVRDKGLSLWEIPEINDGFDWDSLFSRCAEEALFGVYLETGPGLATAVLESHVADYVFAYQAPKFMADAATPGLGAPRHTQHMKEALALAGVRHERFDSDSLTRGYLLK